MAQLAVLAARVHARACVPSADACGARRAQQPTGGVFNTAHEIARRLRDAKDGTAAERAAARRDARAAAQKDEVARSGAAGWLLG